jgi:hypothetical protein
VTKTFGVPEMAVLLHRSEQTNRRWARNGDMLAPLRAGRGA